MAFWHDKSLHEMTLNEWESLCDRCGRCCLHKLEYDDCDDIDYTLISCKLLSSNCNCSDYKNRQQLVPDCISLSVDNIDNFKWLPSTCAYRRLNEKQDLEWWHPLVSGKQQTVIDAGISVAGKTISENHIHEDDLEQFIVRWID